jgi:hypothetical protein
MILNADHPTHRLFLSPAFSAASGVQNADVWEVAQTADGEGIGALSDKFWIGERIVPEAVRKVIGKGRDVLDWEGRRMRGWMACPAGGDQVGWDLML